MSQRVGIDVGGTFTDLVALDDARGGLMHVKVPSEPSAPELGVLEAVDRLLATVDAADIEGVAHSTTIATNALLGQMHLDLARVALLTTEGFRDVIEIGRQNRSEIYDLNVVRPKPLVARGDRIGVRERLDHRGRVLVGLEQSAIDGAVAAVRDRKGVASVAISFLHAYANDAHEAAMARALHEALPQLDISVSSRIDPTYREFERTSTTVVNAALLPLVRGYLQRLVVALKERGITAALHVMQSSGGSASAQSAAERPAAIIESGPASGVIAAANLARVLGLDRVLSFDMGGTTAKAGTIKDGTPQIAGEFEAAGRTRSARAVKGSGYCVRLPFVDLAEVSAGGGTIAYIDAAGALRVGPLSAGADPGPAAYGKSLQPTVTDANIVLGRLNPRALLGGSLPIDAERSRAAVAALVPAMRGLDLDQTAAGIVALIDDQMAKALRIVTVERGDDPRDFALVAFGGAGPLHACALAEELGISRVVVPPAPGLFSAYGLLVADLSTTSVRSIVAEDDGAASSPGSAISPDATPSSGETRSSDRGTFARSIEALFARAEDEGRATLRSQGAADDAIRVLREIDARYAGQSFELTLPTRAPFDDAALLDLVQSFHERHERTYGYAARDERVELVNVRSTGIGDVPKPAMLRTEVASPSQPSAEAILERRELYVNPAPGAGHDGLGRVLSPVYDRSRLVAGNRFSGPAVIEQYDASTYVAPGWNAAVDGYGDIVLERVTGARHRVPASI